MLYCKNNVKPTHPQSGILGENRYIYENALYLSDPFGNAGFESGVFPAGPSREYLNRGVFRLQENIPCALYALEVTDEAYARAKRRADHMMNHGELYRFNSVGLLLCALHIRWNRRRHYFCSQFVSEVLQKSGSLDLPRHSTLMRPNDYAAMPQLKCLYSGRLAGLPQRQSMEMGEVESVVGLYLDVLLGAVKTGARRFF